jgi:hypothetical protein
MAEATDLTGHFKAILGPDVAEELLGGEVAMREFTALSTLHVGPESQRTSREIGSTGSSSKACFTTSFLSIAGHAVTKADGTIAFALRDFHCLGGRFGFQHPVFVLATARRDAPVLVTVTTDLTILNGETDVRVSLFSWAPDGAPAGRVLVNWYCRAATFKIID